MEYISQQKYKKIEGRQYASIVRHCKSKLMPSNFVYLNRSAGLMLRKSSALMPPSPTTSAR